MSKDNKIVITDSFQAWAHKWGRIGTLIALIYMIGLPFVVLSAYGCMPSLGEVINIGTISILMIYIPVGISEAISYTPILGASSYLTFITGNIMNLKLPVAVNAMKITKKVVKNGVMGVLPVIILVTVIALLVRISSGGSLFGAIGFLILFMLPIAIISSRIMWKKGIIKVVDNEAVKNDAE